VGKPAHRLRLLRHALPPERIEAFDLDERDGDISVEAAVMRVEDALLRTLPQKTANLRTAGGEGGGQS